MDQSHATSVLAEVECVPPDLPMDNLLAMQHFDTLGRSDGKIQKCVQGHGLAPIGSIQAHIIGLGVTLFSFGARMIPDRGATLDEAQEIVGTGAFVNADQKRWLVVLVVAR